MNYFWIKNFERFEKIGGDFEQNLKNVKQNSDEIVKEILLASKFLQEFYKIFT